MFPVFVGRADLLCKAFTATSSTAPSSGVIVLHYLLVAPTVFQRPSGARSIRFSAHTDHCSSDCTVRRYARQGVSLMEQRGRASRYRCFDPNGHTSSTGATRAY